MTNLPKMELVRSFVPEAEPVELCMYYDHFRTYYRDCELQTKRWLVRNVKHNWNIIDVGANVGIYSILFSKLAKNGQVLAIEPTDTFEFLNRNINHNGADNILVMKKAVGQTSVVRKDKIYKIWGQAPEEDEYEFTTLNKIWGELDWPQVDLVKIDVDGYDFEVLKGATDLLNTQNPWVIIELNHALETRGTSVNDVLQWFYEMGYCQAEILDHENYLLKKNTKPKPSDAGELITSKDPEPTYISNKWAVSKWLHVENTNIVPVNNSEFNHETNTLSVKGQNHLAVGAVLFNRKFRSSGQFKLNYALDGGRVGITFLSNDRKSALGEKIILEPHEYGEAIISGEGLDQLSGLIVFSVQNGDKQALLKLHSVEFRSTKLLQSSGDKIWNDASVVSTSLDSIITGKSHELAPVTVEICNIENLKSKLGLCEAVQPPSLVFHDIKDVLQLDSDRKILEQIIKYRPVKNHSDCGQLSKKAVNSHIKIQHDKERDALVVAPHLTNQSASSDQSVTIVSNHTINISEYKHSFDTVFVDTSNNLPICGQVINDICESLKPEGLLIFNNFLPDIETIANQKNLNETTIRLAQNFDQLKSNFDGVFWLRPSTLLFCIKSPITKTRGRNCR